MDVKDRGGWCFQRARRSRQSGQVKIGVYDSEKEAKQNIDRCVQP